ncbi:unnamed protein product [Cyprideis torosa]|uniref:Uncharacterized protein n=1 Tax=Cyprideis torosa TaxID=163714 RepID=A0A7R8WBB9_9CRUS|nr:unnamed protein product [Cyprideis torosa]CAG0892148.1 unnamed protein product [Cyprideis torosa]
MPKICYFASRRWSGWQRCSTDSRATSEGDVTVLKRTKTCSEQQWKAAFLWPSGEDIPDDAHFCEQHFAPSDLSRFQTRTTLRRGTVPLDVSEQRDISFVVYCDLVVEAKAAALAALFGSEHLSDSKIWRKMLRRLRISNESIFSCEMNRLHEETFTFVSELSDGPVELEPAELEPAELQASPLIPKYTGRTLKTGSISPFPSELAEEATALFCPHELELPFVQGNISSAEDAQKEGGSSPVPSTSFSPTTQTPSSIRGGDIAASSEITPSPFKWKRRSQLSGDDSDKEFKSDEGSRSTSSTSTPEKETKSPEYFIVERASLLRLLDMCITCKVPLKEVVFRTVGSVLNVDGWCPKCGPHAWSSSPKTNKFYDLNLDLSTSTFLTGMNIASLLRMGKCMGLALPHRTTFYRIQESFVYDAVDTAFATQQEELIEELKEREEIHLAGDGRYSAPELEAFHSELNVYLPKRIGVKKPHFVVKAKVAILDHNANVGRGVDYMIIRYSRSTKRYRLLGVKEEKTDSWRQPIREEVFRLAETSNEPSKVIARKRIDRTLPRTVAKVSRPSKSVLLQEHAMQMRRKRESTLPVTPEKIRLATKSSLTPSRGRKEVSSRKVAKRRRI